MVTVIQYNNVCFSIFSGLYKFGNAYLYRMIAITDTSKVQSSNVWTREIAYFIYTM